MSNHACVGKQNAKKSFDKVHQRWNVYWEDEITGKRKTSSYAYWWWEMNRGKVPDGYKVSYKDGDATNIDPSNLYLMSPEENAQKISKRLMGHSFSDETLQKMHDAKVGKKLSEEHKKKIGEQTKKMWERGVFDTPEIRHAYSEQGKSTKGSKRTEEQKRRLSEAVKAHPRTYVYHPEAIEKQRQKLLGRKQSEESNKRRSETLKGRIFSNEHLQKLSVSGRNRIDIKGENSRFWKGGVVTDPYPNEFSAYLKKKIRKRDNYTCQACGSDVYGSKLGHVHHIDGNKQNCVDTNLVLLCATCHNAVHDRNTVHNDIIDWLKAQLS